jgi:putative transposase
MDKLVKTLRIDGLSKSQVSRMAADLDSIVEDFRHRPLGDAGPFTCVTADALTMKVGEGGRVINAVGLLATGVNNDGHREVLGMRVATAETGAAWNEFFADLVARDLTGVRLVTSDAHAGLREAIAANLAGASWRRCRTHDAFNLMGVTPKAMWPAVRAMLHSVYDQPDVTAVEAQFDRLLDYVEEKLPVVFARLDRARADLPSFTAFPTEIWTQIWSNNPTERLNKEIRRGTDAVGIFPNRDAIVRLVGAVLAEQTDEWAECRGYLGLDVLTRSRMNIVPTTEPEIGADDLPALTAFEVISSCWDASNRSARAVWPRAVRRTSLVPSRRVSQPLVRRTARSRSAATPARCSRRSVQSKHGRRSGRAVAVGRSTPRSISHRRPALLSDQSGVTKPDLRVPSHKATPSRPARWW